MSSVELEVDREVCGLLSLGLLLLGVGGGESTETIDELSCSIHRLTYIEEGFTRSTPERHQEYKSAHN